MLTKIPTSVPFILARLSEVSNCSVLLKIWLQLNVDKYNYYGPVLLRSHVITRNHMITDGDYK
jgi:hypothetical protein